VPAVHDAGSWSAWSRSSGLLRDLALAMRSAYGLAMKLSARNQISARVTGITRGEATTNVQLEAGGLRLVASITTEAAAELSIEEGTEVTAIIKASDVLLGVAE
jgi:molybdopterin-binding protein